MAAQITLFSQSADYGSRAAQVPSFPFKSETATFTPSIDCIARVYAVGADVLLTVNGIQWTVPSGTVEYFGLNKSIAVTVA